MTGRCDFGFCADYGEHNDQLGDPVGRSIVVVDDQGACEEVLQGAPPIIDEYRQEAGEEEKNRHDEPEQAHERTS